MCVNINTTFVIYMANVSVPVEPSMNSTNVDEQTSPQASVIWAGEVSHSGVQAEQTMNTGMSELEVDIPGYVSTQDRYNFHFSRKILSFFNCIFAHYNFFYDC